MELRQNIVLVFLFTILVGLSVWLQFGLLEPPEEQISEAEKNDPDYYVENFTSRGMDDSGIRYEVKADRLVHYPVGDRALLDNPHIVQYDLGGSPRHVYADSGWLYDNRSTILLTGNVRIIEGHSDGVGGIVSGRKMVIHLR